MYNQTRSSVSRTNNQSNSQQFGKISIPDSLDRVKEEFSYLQAQLHQLQVDRDKLTAERLDIQRQYVMVRLTTAITHTAIHCITRCRMDSMSRCINSLRLLRG